MSNKETKDNIPHQFVYKPPRVTTAAHVVERHVGLGLRNAVGRLGNGEFPHLEAVAEGLGNKKFFPNIGHGDAPVHNVCDQFCGWGIRGTKPNATEFLIKFPDPKKWTLQNLKAHNLEFVITKEAVAVHGFEQASVYPVIKAGRLKYPTSILVNESALNELGVTTLQDAVSPTAWKPVRGSEKYAFVIKDGQEHAIKQRGQVAEAVGKTLVVISILIETIFFALQWEHADNKIIHCAQYAANVGLIIGGYAACEAVSSAMITTGFSGLVSGLATFGIGLIFSGIAIGLSYLISWLTGRKDDAFTFCPSLRFESIFEIVKHGSDGVFAQDMVLKASSVVMPAHGVLDPASLKVSGVKRIDV